MRRVVLARDHQTFLEGWLQGHFSRMLFDDGVQRQDAGSCSHRKFEAARLYIGSAQARALTQFWS